MKPHKAADVTFCQVPAILWGIVLEGYLIRTTANAILMPLNGSLDHSKCIILSKDKHETSRTVTEFFFPTVVSYFSLFHCFIVQVLRLDGKEI